MSTSAMWLADSTAPPESSPEVCQRSERVIRTGRADNSVGRTRVLVDLLMPFRVRNHWVAASRPESVLGGGELVPLTRSELWPQLAGASESFICDAGGDTDRVTVAAPLQLTQKLET